MIGRSCQIVGVWEEFSKEIKFKIRFEEQLRVSPIKARGKSITVNEVA